MELGCYNIMLVVVFSFLIWPFLAFGSMGKSFKVSIQGNDECSMGYFVLTYHCCLLCPLPCLCSFDSSCWSPASLSGSPRSISMFHAILYPVYSTFSATHSNPLLSNPHLNVLFPRDSPKLCWPLRMTLVWVHHLCSGLTQTDSCSAGNKWETTAKQT